MVRMTHTLLIEIKQVIEMNCTFAWVHEFKGSALETSVSYHNVNRDFSRDTVSRSLGRSFYKRNMDKLASGLS
jgi:hypothetical protein